VSAALNLTPENRQIPTVLLVEDEVLVRMMLADQLRDTIRPDERISSPRPSGMPYPASVPQHRKFALGEIDYAGATADQAESKPYEGV
jgi:hypothetical protein